jgi:hypothetical protein
MGLINLLTNPKNFKFYNGGQGYTGNGNQPGLTNIPYGKDQVGGGSSGQPYIQIPIQQNITNLGLANSDFILRGGALSTVDAANDVLRLTKMFGDTKSTNGLLFITKQQILSRTAVRTQTSNGALNEGGYNPLGTIAQAGIVNIGGHLNKQGNILGETGAYANNDALYGVKVNSTKPIGENRLVQLYKSNIQYLDINDFGKTLKNSDPVLRSYIGGPGSFLGIGKTNIRFADQRTGINNPLAVTNPNYFFTGTVRSVDNINGNQISQGGILINTDKSWITTGKYNIYNINSRYRGYAKLGTFTSTDLPKFNVNVSQSEGTALQVKNKTSWTPQHIGSASLFYNPTNTVNTVSNEYDNSLAAFPERANLFSSDFWNTSSGEKLWNNSVYRTGSLLENTPLINSQGTYTYTQKDLVKQNKLYGKVQDFRAVLRDRNLSDPQPNLSRAGATNLGQLSESPNYNDFNLEKRVNIGNADGSGPGLRAGKNYSNYTTGVTYLNGGGNVGPLDRINALPVYRSEGVTGESVKNDLVKFRIAIIDNDNPTFKTFVHFRAFLDGISDAYTAEWNPVRYLGRGENFYTYGGYTRQMSLGWTVAAQSKQELIPMYKKLNYLASSLTPDYSSKGYMRGNLAQLTIGGYVYEQPGIITSLTYTLEADTTWEIGINTDGGSDSDVKELPHIIRVTGFNFIPIQKFRPEIQKNENDYKQYIALSDGSGVNDNSYRSLPPEVSTTIDQTPQTDVEKLADQ